MKMAGVNPDDVIDGEIVASPASTEASDGDLSSSEQLAGPEGSADVR